MARARTKRGRLRQIEHWLSDKFPTPRPTIVRVFDMMPGRSEMIGGSHRSGKEIHIQIHSKLTLSQAVDVLHEEWAHAMTWPLARVEHKTKQHGEDWGIAYAKIRHEWDDKTGQDDSMAYPED